MNALLVLAATLTLAQDPQIPAPRGLVNDFAGVIDAATAARIERIIETVRAQSRGEIAVVTMRDIGGREANDIALRIGREWGVGANAPIGDRARNAGVVVLIIPKETASDGRGQVAVQVGQGAEGFISDGAAGDIWRATIPDLRRAAYGAALEKITYGLAERYAREFEFSLDSVPAPARAPARAPAQRGQRRGPSFPVFGLVLAFFVVAIIGSVASRGGRHRRFRGRRGGMGDALPWIILNAVLQSSRGGRSRGGGGGRGGWGGGGGGGFGGFGGGGGFSGGGSSGSW